MAKTQSMKALVACAFGIALLASVTFAAPSPAAEAEIATSTPPATHSRPATCKPVTTMTLDPGLKTTPGDQEEPPLTDGKGAVVYTAGGCFAVASCADGSTVSCSTSSTSGTCTFRDSDCSTGLRGYVECNGTRTWCPADECPVVDPCAHLNFGPECRYFWNEVLQCCDVKQLGPFVCPTACAS